MYFLKGWLSGLPPLTPQCSSPNRSDKQNERVKGRRCKFKHSSLPGLADRKGNTPLQCAADIVGNFFADPLSPYRLVVFQEVVSTELTVSLIVFHPGQQFIHLIVRE